MQVSSPVGTRPAFCAGSCPAAQATAYPFSRILDQPGEVPLSSHQPGLSKTQRPLAPPATSSRPSTCALGRCVLREGQLSGRRETS